MFLDNPVCTYDFKVEAQLSVGTPGWERGGLWEGKYAQHIIYTCMKMSLYYTVPHIQLIILLKKINQ